MGRQSSGRPTAVRIAACVVLTLAPIAGTAQVVLNEIDYDQEGTDAAEFIELYNAGQAEVDLGDYLIEQVNGSNGGLYQVFGLPEVGLAPGGYFVICTDPLEIDLCDFVVGPPLNWLQNGAPDAVALWSQGQLIDTVSYEGETAPPYTEGNAGAPADDPFAGRAAIGRVPDGADSDRNDLDWSAICSTPGAPNADLPPPCFEPEPLVLTLGGDCPGRGEIAIKGGSGGGTAVLLAGTAPGSDPLPAGPCSEPSGLEGPVVVVVQPFDLNGNVTLAPNLEARQCALYLQAVDPTTCRTSGVETW